MSETLRLPDESEKVESVPFVASEEDRLRWEYMIPGNEKHDWVIRNACRLDLKDSKRRRRDAFPKAIVIPVKMSFDLCGMKPEEVPDRTVKPAGHLITFYDTGASIEQMTARNHPRLSKEQCDFGNAGLYGPTYPDERKVRASACWKERGTPGYRQLMLYPAYGWTSAANGLRLSMAMRVCSLGIKKERHVPLRVVLMAMMLYDSFKNEYVKGEESKKLGMLVRPGILVSSSKVNGQYACATYDSVRIAVSLHDGRATPPWSLYYPFGLAMERA